MTRSDREPLPTFRGANARCDGFASFDLEKWSKVQTKMTTFLEPLCYSESKPGGADGSRIRERY